MLFSFPDILVRMQEEEARTSLGVFRMTRRKQDGRLRHGPGIPVIEEMVVKRKPGVR